MYLTEALPLKTQYPLASKGTQIRGLMEAADTQVYHYTGVKHECKITFDGVLFYSSQNDLQGVIQLL